MIMSTNPTVLKAWEISGLIWPNYPSEYSRTTNVPSVSSLRIGDCEESKQKHTHTRSQSYRAREPESERETTMLCGLKLELANVVVKNPNYKKYSFPINIDSRRKNYNLMRRPPQRFQSLSVVQSQYNATAASEPSISSHYTSTVGSSSLQLPQWNLTNRHIVMLQVIACAVFTFILF